MAEPSTQGQESSQTGATLEASEFASLLEKEFKPRSDKAKEAVETAVRTLAEQALRDDLPRLLDQLVNDLTGRLDLADQAHALARQQIHRLDVTASVKIGASAGLTLA